MAQFFSKDVRFYFGGYDPGTAMTSFSLGLAVPALDVTTFTQAAERVLGGHRIDTLEWAGIFDDAGDGINAAMGTLLGTSTNNHVSVLIGTATGNRAYSGTALWISDIPAAEFKGVVREQVVFRMEDQWKIGAHYGPKGTSTGIGGPNNSGSIDNSALSTGSGTLFVHILNVTGGTSSLTLQDSADGITFAANGPVIVATGRRSFSTSVGSGASGTIRRYTRIQELNATGTDVEFVVVLVRGT